MKKQWVLGTLGIAVLVVISIIIGGPGTQTDVQAAPRVESVRAPTATLIMTSTADSGAGTLRQALTDAVSGDTITFDPAVFPPTSPVTIALTSALPNITQGNLTIDASNAGVILDGSGLSGGDGFHITSDGNVVKGLQILYFPDNGVYIGDGAQYNTIGGDRDGERNVISGNHGHGIWIHASGTMYNVVSGNYIGTDVNGTTAISNTDDGVCIEGGASNNFIGGSNATPGGACTGDCNLISGNGGSGVVISDSGTVSNIVSSNYIGTDARGTAALGNRGDGVTIGGGAQHNVIGGDTEGERNIITSNREDGISIWGNGTMSNTVSGNLIGLDLDGTVDLHAQALAISPGYATDATIFVGTEEHGAFKSINGGSSWVAVNIGLTTSNIQALIVSPNYAIDQTIFAGTASGGIFKSTDGGGSWVAVNTGLDEMNVRTLAISPNYGADQTIFAGTNEGIFRSTNGGSNWSAMNSGLTNLNVSALAISPDFTRDQTIFASTWGGGVFKSTDMGLNSIRFS